MNDALGSQIDKLAQVIMDEMPGFPDESEGAVDCAIRIMRGYKQALQDAKLMKSDDLLLKENRIDRSSPKVSL